MMELQKILQKEGLGTRRFCKELIQQGKVKVEGKLCTDPQALFSQKNLALTVENEDFFAQTSLLLALFKPVGFECSQKAFHQSVYSLLPQRFINRGVQAVGRLDVESSGLLFLTDDGQLNHRLTSPKNHIPRVYVVECALKVDEALAQQLEKGVFLKNEKKKSVAQAVKLLGENTLELTLTQGKYHEVRRMLAACGNHVVALKRVAFGNFFLPEDLKEGEFQLIDSSRIF